MKINIGDTEFELPFKIGYSDDGGNRLVVDNNNKKICQIVEQIWNDEQVANVIIDALNHY